MHTFIPSIRDMARRGRSARNVRRDRNTDNRLFSDKQASEICRKEINETVIFTYDIRWGGKRAVTLVTGYFSIFTCGSARRLWILENGGGLMWFKNFTNCNEQVHLRIQSVTWDWAKLPCICCIYLQRCSELREELFRHLWIGLLVRNCHEHLRYDKPTVQFPYTPL